MNKKKYSDALVCYCKHLKSQGMKQRAIRDFIQSELGYAPSITYLSRLLK